MPKKEKVTQVPDLSAYGVPLETDHDAMVAHYLNHVVAEEDFDELHVHFMGCARRGVPNCLGRTASIEDVVGSHFRALSIYSDQELYGYVGSQRTTGTLPGRAGFQDDDIEQPGDPVFHINMALENDSGDEDEIGIVDFSLPRHRKLFLDWIEPLPSSRSGKCFAKKCAGTMIEFTDEQPMQICARRSPTEYK